METQGINGEGEVHQSQAEGAHTNLEAEGAHANPGAEGAPSLLELLERSISACRQAKTQFEISTQAMDGFEGEQASILIHSIWDALKAVVEVANCWDGTVTFANSNTGSDLLAQLYDQAPVRDQERDQFTSK